MGVTDMMGSGGSSSGMGFSLADVGIGGSGGSAGPSAANSAIQFGDTTVASKSKWQSVTYLALGVIGLMGLAIFLKRKK